MTMAVRSTEELLGQLKTVLGENASDEALGLVEDFSDTLTGLSEQENWKQKYEENDAQWRQKYRDRFFSREAIPQEPEEAEERPKPRSYQDLFTTKG